MSIQAKLTLFYFIFISLFSSFLTVSDKLRAKHNRRRISEKALFLSALLGGSLFEYLSMKLIRHKTLHKRFMLGLPLIFLFQAAALVFVYLRFVKTGIIVL